MTHDLEINIAIDKESVKLLSEIQEKFEEMDDLIPNWNKVEADKIREDLQRIFYKILQPIEVHKQ